MAMGNPSLTELFGLDGRVALITGAGGGLGRAMAAALAGAGAQVYVNDLDGAAAARTAEEIVAGGGQASALPFNVEDAAAREAAVARIEQETGRLDILINCVGVRHRVSLDAMTAEDFNRMYNNHVTSGLMLVKLGAPLMQRHRFGRIVLLSSMVAFRGRATDIGYQAAKGAIGTMTRGLAAEFGAEGITCNAIAPGIFATEGTREIFANEQVMQGVRSQTPVRRAGEPEDLCGAAVFLCSPASAYLTGQIIVVDGGSTACMG